MSESLRETMGRLNAGTQGVIKDGVQQVSMLPPQTAAEWFAQVVTRAKGNESISTAFRDILTRTPDEALRAVLSGKAYLDSKSLSSRLWTEQGRLEGSIDDIIQQGIAQKKSAYEMAKDLETYVNPEKVKPWDWHKVYPGIPFPRSIDYNAQRVARTSINHAYHLAMLESAKLNPLCEAIHWELSLSHEERQIIPFGPDEYDEYAANDDGFGKGNFAKGNVPMPHPCCLCVQWAVTPSLDDAAKRLRNWVDGGEDKALESAFRDWQTRHGADSQSANTRAQDAPLPVVTTREKQMSAIVKQAWAQSCQ